MAVSIVITNAPEIKDIATRDVAPSLKYVYFPRRQPFAAPRVFKTK